VIPGTLDDPPKFLFWDMDQAMVFLSMFMMGLIAGFIASGLILAGVFGWLYGKSKTGKHRAYIIHMMYWYLPSSLVSRFQVTPPSHERQYLG
ncbi:MAG: type IV conjugative transfer system protein TraL, partial [Candidatus Pacearchaeota archaeon]|nr:type IV conjugative transfer system protein TraL [Candidatus Pacearchaeota archaeon]